MPDEPIGREDFRRLEAKVESIAQSLKTVILLEERQGNQGQRLGNLEQRMAADEAVTSKLERNLSSWVNRGIGVWSVAVLLFALSNSKVVLGLFGVK